MAPSSFCAKRQNTTKETPGTNVSSHRSSRSISIDASTKIILQGRLADLNYLVRVEEGLAVHQELQRLIIRVANEIEKWLNGGGTMEFRAQLALSNVVYNRSDKDNQFLCKHEKCFLTGYLSILRSAISNGALTHEKRRILSNLLCESEGFLNEPENATTDKAHQDELNLLHVICDSNISLHSIETAVQTLDKRQEAQRSWELSNQAVELLKHLGEATALDRAIAMLGRAVAFTPLNNPNRPKQLDNLGNCYVSRFNRFREGKDIDSAIERQHEAVLSTPLGSADLPKRLNNLAISHTRRFEQFGEVKDIDSAIQRHRESVASTPLDIADLPGRLNDLGNSHAHHFERFGVVKDLDLAIDRHREAVASTPLDSSDLPGRLNSLGISHARRFERFGEVKDLDLAIERQREAIASTPVGSPDLPGQLNNLGNSHLCRFERFREVKDIDLAIKWHCEAVASTPIDNVDLPGRLNNLGNSHLRRFERFGAPESGPMMYQHL